MRKFILRDLFWLALVVALGCAWWSNREQLESELDRQGSALQTTGKQLTHERKRSDFLRNLLEQDGYTITSKEISIAAKRWTGKESWESCDMNLETDESSFTGVVSSTVSCSFGSAARTDKKASAPVVGD